MNPANSWTDKRGPQQFKDLKFKITLVDRTDSSYRKKNR